MQSNPLKLLLSSLNTVVSSHCDFSGEFESQREMRREPDTVFSNQRARTWSSWGPLAPTATLPVSLGLSVSVTKLGPGVLLCANFNEVTHVECSQHVRTCTHVTPGALPLPLPPFPLSCSLLPSPLPGLSLLPSPSSNMCREGCRPVAIGASFPKGAL